MALYRRTITLVLLALAECTSMAAGHCRTAVPGDKCYDAVIWAMRDAIGNRPELYPGLDASSTFEEFQALVAKDSRSECSQPCQLNYPVTSQVKYRMEPKPVIKGVAYRPLLETRRGRQIQHDEPASDLAAVVWASWGRGDLATIRRLGANTVRLYSNEPRTNKRTFLDEALRQGLDVIMGMSDDPYLQSSDNCRKNDFDCFDAIHRSYKQSLLNGLTVHDHTAYHSALTAMVIINEPEHKFTHETGDCKLVVSALDGMLQAEKDLGVVGNPIAFTTAYSLAPRFGASATGSMVHLSTCFMQPQKMANYFPRNDVTQAYLTRWVNSFNAPTPVTQQLHLLDRYARSPCWTKSVRIPLFIGEYHAPDAAPMLDLPAMFEAVHDTRYPFFLGFNFFEFQKRYDKAESPAFGMKFGMYSFSQTCVIARINVRGETCTVRGLASTSDLDRVVAATFGGEPVDHQCPHVTSVWVNRSFAPSFGGQKALQAKEEDGNEEKLSQHMDMLDSEARFLTSNGDDPLRGDFRDEEDDDGAEPENPEGNAPADEDDGEEVDEDDDDEDDNGENDNGENVETTRTPEKKETLSMFVSRLQWPKAAAAVARKWQGALGDSVGAEFKAYATEHGLDKQLTDDEIKRYRGRFEEAAKELAKTLDISLGSHFDQHKEWKEQLRDVLKQQMPAVTKHLADHINQMNVGWTAKVSSWADNFAIGDAKTLMGFIHDPEIENTTLDHFSQQARRLRNFPASFDSRDQWPQCRDTIGHVRDQGKCGSCWAQSVAGMMDGRICIASEGRFSGHNAWTSAGYITSCYNMIIINGCSGGNPGWALTRIKKSFIPGIGGAPTGSDDKDNTCVPYFASGDALKHFEGKNVQAPKCPRACTGSAYKRTLSKDLLYTSSPPSTSNKLTDAKRALTDGGSIAMAFTVFQDFMAYSSGFYDRTTDKQMGGHATTLIGWVNNDYLLSVNSWGTKWGEKGLFKMKNTCCGVSYFFADVEGRQRALPLPDGPSAAAKPPPGSSAVKSGRRRFFDRFKSTLTTPRLSGVPVFGAVEPDGFPMYGAAPLPETAEGSIDWPVIAATTQGVQAVMEVAGLNCASVGARESAIMRAASLAIVGTMAMLLPSAVVMDLNAEVGRVSVLPCAMKAVFEESEGVVEEEPTGSIMLPSPGPWDCGGVDGSRNATGIYFVVSLPEGAASAAGGESAVVEDAVRDTRLQDAVGRRLREALAGFVAANLHVARQCVSMTATNIPAGDASVYGAAVDVLGASRADSSTEDEEAGQRRFSIALPTLALPALVLVSGWAAVALVWQVTKGDSEGARSGGVGDEEEGSLAISASDGETQAPLMG